MSNDSTTESLQADSAKPLILILICFSVASICFSDKAFHSDEPVYVWIAQQICKHPTDYFGFTLNWEGHVQPVSQFDQNPPLLSYVLAVAGTLGGWSERSLRMAILPINLLTLIGSWHLAREFCSRPALVLLMVLCTPAFFVCANSVMCEPLSLCMCVWSVVVWIRLSCGSVKLAPLTGLLIGLAVLAKYSSICLFPLLIGYAIIFPADRRTRWAQLASLLIAFTILTFYELYTFYRYRSGALFGAVHYMSTSGAIIHASAGVRLINTTAFIGGSLASAVGVAMLQIAWRYRAGIILVCAVLGVTTAIFLLPPQGWIANDHSVEPGLVFYLQYAAMLAGGLAIVVVCASSLRSPSWRHNLFLCLWIGGVFIFTAFFNWAINVRSILPMTVPVCILIVRQIEMSGRKRGILPALVTAATITFAVEIADCQLAEICRSAAPKIVRIAAMESRNAPWFAGHSGFQYYMQLAGAKAVDNQNPRCKPGEIIVFPTNNYGQAPGATGLEFVKQVQNGIPHWISTMQSSMGAGFYCSYGYALPFVIGPIPAESFTILRITPKTRIFPGESDARSAAHH